MLEGEELEPPEPHLLHRYFESVLCANEDRSSSSGVRFRGSFLSYKEVNRQANLTARKLKECLQDRTNTLLYDHGKPPIIAVDMEPCERLVVVLLAILKIGAAYLPVDSQSAINRVKYILDESKPICVLVDNTSTFKSDMRTVWSRFHVIDVEIFLGEALNSRRDVSDADLQDDERLLDMFQPIMAIVYTSGSTGTPKGVRLKHVSALNRLFWQWKTMPFSVDEVGCFKTSLLFVDSIVEIFAVVLKLVPLAICPKGFPGNPELFVPFLEEERVSRLVMVPSLLRNVLFYVSISGGSARLPALRLWISNSETLYPGLLEKFFDIFHSSKIFANLYGSTETMADVSYEIFRRRSDIYTKLRDNKLSIGRPMFNSKMYIVDENMLLVNGSETGEIYVSGLNVADGYVDSERKLQAFLDNPFATCKYHSVMYKTGDFGCIVNGAVIYEGRRDTQVKIRGNRVNIAEIETVLQSCGEVDKVVVLCHKFSEISSVIVAYYTSPLVKSKPQRLDSRLMSLCRKSLPDYMMPKVIHVEEIPLQPHTGKVDRLALRRVYEKVFNRQSSKELAILDEKGQKALNILALNLNLPRHAILRRKSFFELGGNSVTMISTIVQLREHSLHIPIEVFSSARTIQDIVDHVTISNSPIGESMQTHQFVVKFLKDLEGKEKIIDVLVDSFIEKEPLDVLLGVTREEFLPFALSLYSQACQNSMSLVVLDSANGDIVGGDFLFDYFDGIKVDHHESMAPILSLLQSFEEPVKKKLTVNRQGKLIFNFCLCVHKDLPHADQVTMCHLLEGTVIQVARDLGYEGIITNNTNPATQNICEHFYDYELLSKFLVRDFEFNNRKVFAHAPEDYYIKMMIKYV